MAQLATLGHSTHDHSGRGVTVHKHDDFEGTVTSLREGQLPGGKSARSYGGSWPY
jgi:hypothetical protein